MTKKLTVNKKYSTDSQCVLFRGDCLELLAKMADESVNITITSPPYCIGKSYESTEDVDDFIRAHEKILPEIARVTKLGGSICWQVGYHVKAREIVPLDFLVYDILRKLPDMRLRNRIVWTFGHGLHETERFTGRHETILWFTKGDEYEFNLDSVRVPQKYPGKKYYKGPMKGEYSGNPLGKNPSDLWDIPNVKAKHKEKTIHPCQFPLAIPHRLIKALAPKDGIVLDPFSGVGTTGAAAILLGRRFVGAEIDPTYWDVAAERLKAAAAGTLLYRSADEPVFDPAKAGAVAEKPVHFTWANNQPMEELNGIETA